jgi:hypothetical protein
VESDGLAALEKWCRKHYRFFISFGGGVMPGDGVGVQLEGGGRTVRVDEEDLVHCDEDESALSYPTISDIIWKALRRWHADDTLKQYHGVWQHPPEAETPPANHPEIQWHWLGSWSQTVIWAKLQARNEAEAISKIRALYGPDFAEEVCVQEVAPQKKE